MDAISRDLKGTTSMRTKSLLAGTAASVLALSLAGSLPGFAQDVNPSAPASASSGGWRKFPTDPSVNPAPDPQPPAPQPTDQQSQPPRTQVPTPQVPIRRPGKHFATDRG
jgi:hypothetical protein